MVFVFVSIWSVWSIWLVSLWKTRKSGNISHACLVHRRIGRRFFALLAVQDSAEILPAALGCQYPGTAEKRGMVPDMLAMAAGQICHPMPFFVLMIADDRLIHALIIPATVSVRLSIHRYRFSNGSSGRSAAGTYTHRFSWLLSKLPRKTTWRSKWRNSDSDAVQSRGSIIRASNCPTT